MTRVLVAVALALITGACNQEAANPFGDAESCDELVAMFEDFPVSDDPDERKEVGDAYREQFRALDCEL